MTTIGVVGAGAMGQGIAQVAATGGMTTLIVDAKPGAAASATETILGRIDRMKEKGRLDDAAAEAAKGRLRAVDAIAELADCDLVVEAVIEDLGVKRDVFAAIEAVVGPDCLIASNTSSLSIASLARACHKPERVAGLHFFNPVPLMKLVEVVRGPETSAATIEALRGLGEGMGRVPVVVRDAPGFLVNMGGRAFSTEGARLAHEGVATPAQIDAVMRDCCGYRMGPFELMDLTGMDVNVPVSRIVYEGYLHDPRLKTSPNHVGLLDAGRLGRKSGAGWFDHGDNAAAPDADHAGGARPANRVRLAEPDPRLESFCREIGVSIDDDDGAAPILGAPVGEDATAFALRTGADFRRLVALDLLCDTRGRVTLMTAPGADPAILDAVAATLIAAGRKVTAIKDSPGFVAQRMQAMIANLGCYMAEIGLASPEDIDTAMKLGLNYPRGPLELAENMGAETLLTIMRRLQALTGEDRYRPTGWLRRRAGLGLPIHTPN